MKLSLLLILFIVVITSLIDVTKTETLKQCLGKSILLYYNQFFLI